MTSHIIAILKQIAILQKTIVTPHFQNVSMKELCAKKNTYE